MAAAVHDKLDKLFHPHSHGSRNGRSSKDESQKTNSNSEQSHQHPAQRLSASSHGAASPHHKPSYDREGAQMDRAREDEKHNLLEWQAQTRPLSPSEIHKDPERKVVGHSSQSLRQEDFELVKTLGTGAHRSRPVHFS
jgi:hypothetical protein